MHYPSAEAACPLRSVKDAIRREGFVVLTDRDPIAIVTLRSSFAAGDAALGDCVHCLPVKAETDEIDELLTTMDECGSDVLPIARKDGSIGVVTRKDIAESLHAANQQLNALALERTKQLRDADHQLRNEMSAHRKTIQNLCESEERFRTIFKFAPAAIWIHDGVNTLYSNPFARGLLEADARENILSLLETADKQRISRKFADILKHGKTGELSRATIHRRDGSRRVCEGKTGLITLDGRECLITVALDITANAALADTLAEKELRFRNLIDNLSEAIWYIDKRGITQYVNKACCDLQRVEAERMIGAPAREHVSPRHRRAAARWLHEVANGRTVNETVTFAQCHKQPRCFHIAMVPDYDRSGAYCGCIVSATEITEAWQAQQELEQSKNHFIELADSISELFFALDGELRISYWGKAIARLSGLTPERALGKPLLTLFPFDPSPGQDGRVYRTVMQTKNARRMKYRYGEQLYEVSVYPFGKGVTIIAHNRSEEMQLDGVSAGCREQELKALGQQIHNGIGQYISAIAMRSEEFRLKTAQMEPITANDIESFHAVCTSASESMYELMQSLLMKAGDDVSDYDMLRSMSVPLERTFNVRISLPEQRERLLPRNRYDRRHVIRFIQEALTNAAKHSNALNIRLTVKRDGRQAIYEISDHGQGFQPGKRAGGMGLRLMQFNADEAGGEFEIDTSRTGTVVRLRLPAYKTGLICNANIRK